MRNMMKAATVTAVAGTILFAAAALAGPAKSEGEKSSPNKAAIEKIVHDYLIAHPELLIDMSNALQVKQAADEEKAQKQALASLGKDALLDPKISYATGPANAPVTVAEFFDYRCVHCKNSLAAIKKIVLGGENVRFVFIEHPILTEDSLVAARAAVAARRQKDKYVPFHFALMDTTGDLPEARILDIAAKAGLDVEQLKKDMKDPAVQKSVEAANALADKLHVDGTPTFVFGGKFVGGELTYDQMEDFIKEVKS